MANFQFALRALAKSPVVSIVAILSLALGIGANTAIFSLFEQSLMRKLPVDEPGQLVNITANGPRNGSNSSNNAGNQQSIFSYAMFRDLERAQTAFTGVAAHRSFGVSLSYQGQSSGSDAMYVSGSYFPVLGLRPAAGRLFGPNDDKNPGEHRLVVLGHAFWKEKFNANPEIVGKTMMLNGVLMAVLGVAPEGFRGTTLGANASVFVPISMREALTPGWKGLSDRRSYWAYAFARLKPGVSMAQAQSSLHGAYMGFIRDVELKLQTGMSERGRARFLGQQLTLEPGDRGQSTMLARGKTPMVLLFSITGFVLLIACANIANLLLARSANRAKEFSIRLSLGASRSQLILQLMAESMVLAVLSGFAGIFVAYATGVGIQSFLPGGSNQFFDPGARPATILFALAISLVAGFLFGLFPAMHSTRLDLAGAMKDQAGNVSASGAASRFRRILVTAQIALSLMLLISAGMFLRSLVNVLNVNLGMRTHNVVSLSLAPELNQYSGERTRIFFEQLEARAAAIPGVEGASLSMVGLISGNNWGSSVSVDGFQAGPDTDTHSMYNEIGPGFMKLMSVPLVGGREFSGNDGAGAPKVALVNEAFERKFGNGRSLLGKRMQVGSGKKNDIEIVGVAKDTKYSEVKDAIPPMFYLPYRQDPRLGSALIYVATSIPIETVIPALRQVVASLDPNLPIGDIKSLEATVKENIGLDRMISTLAAAFALLATLLAAIGLYGVLAFTVTRRTREIGIRLAVGADAARIRNMVMREVIWMIGIGVVIGLPAAIGLLRYAESLLYGIQSSDPLVLASAIALITIVSLVAGFIPAMRAMRVEPLIALRYE